MNKITVVDLRRAGKSAQYLGREMLGRGLKGNPLGNPIRLTDESQRESVLYRYRVWLDGKLEAGDVVIKAELNRLYKLALEGDLELACWRAPCKCDCDDVEEKLEAALKLKNDRALEVISGSAKTC